MIKNLSLIVFCGLAMAKLFADPIDVLYPNQVACHGDCVEFVPEVISLKQPATFLWVTGDTTSSIVVCPEFGNAYKVTITDADGQTAVISAIVSVANDHLKPKPDIISPVCSGDRLKFTHPNYGFIGTYSWFGPNQFASTDREFIIEDAQTNHSGRYGMYIDYYDKCPTDTVYIDVYVSPDKNYFQEVDSINVCNTFCAIHYMGLVKTRLHANNSSGRQPEYLDTNKTKTPTNILWCSFVAQEGVHTVEINIDWCQNISTNVGAIVGIYADKEFTQLVASSDTCMKGVFKVPSSMFEPAKTYYIFIDGCGGNICDVRAYTLGQAIPKYCNDYVPMSNVTSWKYNYSNFGFSGEFWMTSQGDTTIFGKVYKKISGYPANPLQTPILIREDIKNRIVYQYQPGLGEFVLYNFNLKVGDSFRLPTTNISFNVFLVDSISSQLGILKRWFFANPGFGGFVYTECLGGDQLEFYRSVMIQDPVYGLNCAFADCKPVIQYQSCLYPEPNILRDTVYQTICGGENFMGYDATGQYSITQSSESYCAEITHLNLTVLSDDLLLIDTILCEGHSFLGIELSGDYMFHETNVNGCDSTTIIHIDIEKKYEWQSEITICHGSVLTVRDWLVDQAGIYTDTIYTSRGCVDSIFVLEVAIIDADTLQLDTTICEGETYLGHSLSGIYNIDTIDLNTGCLVNLVLTLDVLPATSPECMSFTESQSFFNRLIYPNPASTHITIDAGEGLYPKKGYVYNSLGQLVQTCELQDRNAQSDISSLTPGLYFIRVTDVDDLRLSSVGKWVKE